MRKLFFLPFLFLLACTEPIDLDLNTAENIRLVVDAEIDNLTSRDTIFLSFTSNFFENTGNVPATGAIVTITDLESNRQFQFSEMEPGSYVNPLNFVGKEGVNYRLDISVDGKNYSSESLLKPAIKIDTLTCRRVDENSFFNAGEVRIGISFQDPPNQEDYYWFIDYVNGQNMYESLFEYGALFNDELVNGVYLNDIEYGTFDLDSGDVVKIEMRTINKRAEEIISALAIESFESGVFDAPPSNVPSNISNGALGLFVAMGKSVKSIEINK